MASLLQVDSNSGSFTGSLQGSATSANSASFSGYQYAAMHFISEKSASLLETGYLGAVTVPVSSFIEKIELFSSNSGSVSIDIRKNTYAGWSPNINNGTSITGSTLLSMSKDVRYQDSALSNWTRTIDGDDVISFLIKVISGSSTGPSAFDKLTIAMKLRKIN